MAACSLWLREHHCNFIMVCLPQSHSFLYEQVADLTKLNAVSQVVVKRWTYHFVNDVLLRDSADAMTVNWCELIITRDDTQAQLYQDGRYGCPLAMAGEQDAVCPVHHHNWEKGGCLTTLPTSIGNHVRHELDRQSDEFRRIYRLRTASERINSQALDLGIERPHLRNGRSIANRNTLIYVLINLHAVQRVRKRQTQPAQGPRLT
jgi:hypothetical protein